MNEPRLENILQKFIKWGIFLIPFLVLIISRSLLYPYITGKGFFFMAVVEALFGAYLALLIVNGKKYAPRKNILVLAAAIFLFVVFLADVFGVNPHRSFWSTYERMEGFILYLHLFIFFIISSSVLNRKDWFMFFHISIFVSLLVSGYVWIGKMGILKMLDSGLVSSTMGNSIYLAVYLFAHLFLTIFYLFRSGNYEASPRQGRKVSKCFSFFIPRSRCFHPFVSLQETSGHPLSPSSSLARPWGFRAKGDKIWFAYLAIFIFELSVFIMTGVRSVFLGIVGAFITAFFIKMLLSIKKKEKMFWGALTIFIVLIPFLLIMYRSNDMVKNNPLLNRFSSISFSENTAQSRVMIWGIAIKGFMERPILGWGQGNFIISYAINYNPKLYGNEPWFDRTHNTLLQWLADAGIIGLAGYLLVIAAVLSALNKIRKKRVWSKNQMVVFLAFAAGYFIQSFFVFDTLVSYFILAAILGFLVCESENGEDGKRFWIKIGRLVSPLKLSATKRGFIKYGLIVFIFAAIIVWGVTVNGKAVSQGKLLVKSLLAIESANEADLFKTAAIGFKNAVSVNSFGTEEARIQLASFVLEAAGRKSRSFLENADFLSLLDLAIGEMEKETKADKFNLRPLISLARLYEIKLMLNQNKESFDLVESAFRDAFYFKNYAPLYFYFAEYRLNLRDSKTAASVITRLMENFDESPKLLNDVEKVYVVSGYHNEAWKAIYKNAAFGQWPSAADFLWFGRVAMEQKNIVEASKYGINALKLARDNQSKKEILLFLYEAEKKLGNQNKAEFYMLEAEKLKIN